MTPSALIIDLGGVLSFQASFCHSSTSIPAVKRLQSTSTWMRFESGEIDERTCYELLGKKFNAAPSELKASVSAFRESASYDETVRSVLNNLKGTKRVAVWNVTGPDYKALSSKWGNKLLDCFDHEFPSFAVGLRMPDIRFFKHVLDELKMDPAEVVFIGSAVEKVVAARSLGIQGVLANSQPLPRTILNATHDPVARGNAYLQRNAGHHQPFTDDGVLLMDNYLQFLILEVTGDENLVAYQRPDPNGDQTWNYYIDQPEFTKFNPPNDLDTTSFAIQMVPQDRATIHGLLDKMLNFLSPEGLLYTYFDIERPRVDPIVCTNAYITFHLNGRAHQLATLRDWLHSVLKHRAYADGTYYYRTAEWFLFYICRLLEITNDPDLKHRFGRLLRQRVKERIGLPGDSLVLGMRVYVCNHLDVNNYQDLKALLALQCEDGGWEPGYLYDIPIVGKKILDRGFSTALAVKVIEEARE